MKIERENIQLAPLDLDQLRMSGTLMGLKQAQKIPLNTLQIEMIELMSLSYSIEKIVRHFLYKKILISFIGLRDLVQVLLKENLILNSSFADYFAQTNSDAKPKIFSQFLAAFRRDEEPSESIQEELKQVPFLRSLSPELLKLFFKNMVVIRVPSGFTVCRQGDVQRSLFVLLRGQATVYKKNSQGKRMRVAALSEGSVFGEVGFLLGEPRLADVVTDVECQVVRLKYRPEIFDALIEKEKARHLQKRFWIIHSLLKSEIFRSVPDDCFDSLVFSGELRQFPADTLICKQGELGESCFIVVQGSLVVTKDGESIRVLQQGDSFGEIALMNNQGKRSANVKTQTEVLALELHYEKFYQLLSQNIILACEFEKLASQRLQADHLRN